MDKTIRLKGRLKQYFNFAVYLGILLLLVNIVVYLLDIRAGIVLSVFCVCYFAITIWILVTNKRLFMKDLVDFATEYGQVQRVLMEEFDVPYALLDENGRYVWGNERFREVVGKSVIGNVNIGQLLPPITKEKLPLGELDDSVDLSFTYNEKEYRARISRLTFDQMLGQEQQEAELAEQKNDNFLLSVFLYDETALKYAVRQVDEQSLAIGLLCLDNYDEALESIEAVRRSLLVALIDRKVNKYFSAVDGICAKLEKDNYLLVLRKMNLKK